MTEPDPRDRIADAAMTILREHGALTTEEWGRRLADAGYGSAREIEDVVEALDDYDLGFLPDGRNLALGPLLEGRTLTHRLTDAEIAAGILDANPDLTPLTTFAFDSEQGFRVVFEGLDDDVFAERGVTDPDFLYDEGLLLEPGALAGYAAGDLVAITAVDGGLELRRVAGEPASAPDLTAALRRIVPEDAAEHLDALVWQLMIDDPALFVAPTVPLAELIDAAGYVRDGDYLAVRGFDFATHRLAAQIGMVAREHELHPDEARAVVEFLDLVRQTQEQAALGADPRTYAHEQISADVDAFVLLSDPAVAAAALELVSEFDDRTEALHAVAVGLVDLAPRRAKAAACWLAGKAADRLGDVLAARSYYDEALSHDPDWIPAIFDLALLAADGGDVTRAQSLLGRIEGGESEALHDVLQRFAPREHPELGRNDRCWCGSGRKYKACHLGRSELTSDDRAAWLYSKAQLFMRSPELFDILFDLAEIHAAPGADDGELLRAIEGGPAVDVALFEGGLFELFVGRRGALLPAEELDLAGQWVRTRRSVYTVVAAADDVVTLQDLRGDDTVEVTHEGAGRDLNVGAVVCARLLPTGSATLLALGGMEPVEASAADDLVALLAGDPEPEALVEFLGAHSLLRS
ncbi:SEC-C metal-binding domain-containing protein [Rhodococcus sp. BE178]|uniref:SEC-C metal-binding domain-containing protein n=1 Tax=Rhodococcus sp. BE178 TaxID=2817737 RepID=UPI003D24EBEE